MTELTIAHISDIHAGSPYFVPSLMDRVVIELNELKPDIVLCAGDLTEMGFRQDYMTALEYLKRIEAPLVVVPGNHDSRNVGYVHFEELIGPRGNSLMMDDVAIVALDSSEPDLDYGQIGRARYGWLREQYAQPAAFRIFMLHHHLLPIPGTGRERSMVLDAGDLLEVLQECGVNLVLSGHKHVPYAWRLEHLFVVNAGTCSSLRLRGNTKACYNLIRIRGRPGAGGAQVPVPRRGDADRLRPVHGVVRQVHLPGAAGGGEQIGARLPRAVVLVDGEHYPPVVAAAVARLRDTYSVEAGIFAGGREKLRGDSGEGGADAGGAAGAAPATAWPPSRRRSGCRGWTQWSRGPRPRTRCSRACAPRCARRAPRRSSTSRTSRSSATASGSCS